MSDQSVEATATGTPEVVPAEPTTQPQEGGMTILRVSGGDFPLNDTFTFGEDDEDKVTITRAGTQVPDDQVEKAVALATAAGFKVEVVPE